jgi:outer membrane lipoprotein
MNRITSEAMRTFAITAAAKYMKFSTGILLILGLLLTACATTPPAIRQAPPGDLQLGEARDDVSAHRGTPVRWGGVIVSVENKDNETWIEVLEHKLSRFGEPKRYSPSAGRFLIRVSRFLDPLLYTKGREITVIGILEGEAERSIGKQPYSFPVVKADEHYLGRPDRRYRYDPPYNHYGYYPRYHYGFGYGHGYYPHHGFHFRFHY